MTLSVGPDSLTQLARRPELVAAFPFLRALTRNSGAGCGGCGTGPSVGTGWSSVADSLFSLSPQRKAEFKAAAGVTVVSRRVVRGGKSLSQSF